MRADLISAMMLLTRVPVRGTPSQPAARAAWAWPFAGLVVGLPAALVLWGAGAAGLTPGFAAALALAVLVAATGALHEDGLADTADGIWGGRDAARRLEIMRDSRIGTYGTVALILSLLARWSLLVAATDQGGGAAVLLASAVAGRAAMPWMLHALPPARADGLAQGVGRPSARAVAVALLLGGAALLPWGLRGVLAAAVAAGAVLALAHLARARLGGQTGDVCGAAQQVAEIAILAALTAR